MADPLARTFDLLATAKNMAAVDLLLAALDSNLPLIQDRAVAALLRRGATRCQTEVIRRLAQLSSTARKLLEEQGVRLSGTLRQCLVQGDDQLRANAMTIVATMECYDQVPTLLQILERRDDPFGPAACRALQDLCNRLFEHCHLGVGRKGLDRAPRNLPQAQQNVLVALENACNRFADLTYPREIVECILVLGDPDSAAVRKALLQGVPACRETASELLLTSKHPGVIRLLMAFMDENYPIAKALEAFASRSDSEFVFSMLRVFPRRLSENQQKNFKQLTRIDWIADELLPLESVPPDLHESLVAFVQATGISLDDKSEIEKWVLLRGSMQGRQAATKILETQSPETVRAILFDSLESEEEDVQAWATSQLRAQGVPEAIRLLVERLDSPMAAVRDAARGELQSFNLPLMFNLFEHIDPKVCLRAGALIRKTDPQYAEKLLEELNHPIQRRRIRAARAASALGLAKDVEKGLLTMLADADSHVRRIAAEALASVPTLPVVASLTELLQDTSPRVREAAVRSLETIGRLNAPAGAFSSVQPVS